jgi:hypothetical protein
MSHHDAPSRSTQGESRSRISRHILTSLGGIRVGRRGPSVFERLPVLPRGGGQGVALLNLAVCYNLGLHIFFLHLSISLLIVCFAHSPAHLSPDPLSFPAASNCLCVCLGNLERGGYCLSRWRRSAIAFSKYPVQSTWSSYRIALSKSHPALGRPLRDLGAWEVLNSTQPNPVNLNQQHLSTTLGPLSPRPRRTIDLCCP